VIRTEIGVRCKQKQGTAKAPSHQGLPRKTQKDTKSKRIHQTQAKRRFSFAFFVAFCATNGSNLRSVREFSVGRALLPV
jgi:hypothetical protein